VERERAVVAMRAFQDRLRESQRVGSDSVDLLREMREGRGRGNGPGDGSTAGAAALHGGDQQDTHPGADGRRPRRTGIAVTACVDTSLILKCLMYEPGSDAATAWLEAHQANDLVAPWILLVEVASVLLRKAQQGYISDHEAGEALDLLDMLRIRLHSDSALVHRAFELAVRMGLPVVYDTLYLAVAEREHCDLWTADARFVRACAEYPFVRLCSS